VIGRTLSRYRIVEQLGAGGMGVVYRAHDERLERDVALKVLPDGALADEAARQRFQVEARALSRLNHPHIGLVYDFDTLDGVDFLVLEYIPGDTLATTLARGPLPEPAILALGGQIAEALDAAHERGVLHRDLKPANVVVTPGGQAKVLDFGLARMAPAAESAGVATMTRTQTIAGTVPYMAPEQLLGSATDHRIDVFALGAVLYEMATGQAPFQGSSSPALVNAILNQRPMRPRELNPALSMELESVVLRSLEKDPERRWPTARAVAEALSAVRERRGAPLVSGFRIGSIAVLPLEDLAHDAEQEYFADGMTESLIAELSRIHGVRVISRTSAMRFKGVRRPLPEIARELGVDGVVEGSVLRAGERVRITVRLLDAGSETTIWSGRYERDLSDVLALQGEVAAKVAGAIQVELTGEDRARLAEARTLDPQAYEAYLKGRYWWNRRTEDAVRRGTEWFERAIEREPTYARAYSGLADCYNILADNNWIPPEPGFARARAAARRAIELDPTLAEAHTSLAYVTLFHDWNWEQSGEMFRRALELGPEYPTALQWYAGYLAALGRFDESIAAGRRAIELDPLSTILYTSLGDHLYYAGRFAEAIEQTQHALELDPRFYLAYNDLARAYEQNGDYEQAVAHYTKGAELAGKSPGFSAGLACVHAYAGRRAEAERIRDALIERSRTAHVPAYALASISAALGDVEPAVEWLERAVAHRDRALIWMRVNPRFRPLRPHARFTAVARQVGFPE
jgi:serine/threonine-protein kinase